VHAVTIRRLIVFSVCALGVGSLYLVPGVAKSPEQIRLSGATEESAGSPAEAPSGRPQQSASTAGTRESVAGGGGGSLGTAPGAPATTRTAGAGDSPDRSGRSSGGAQVIKDSEPPHPVATIEPARVTPEQLTISWPAAADNVGVIGYSVWLNGFEVATTAETQAQLRWFNDDSGQHVVQIRALDAAGNQSASSPTLLVTRPSPEPTPTPMPEPSDSPTPSVEPSEPSQPGARPSESPARPNGHKSNKDR
jgi:hypothetical protein